MTYRLGAYDEDGQLVGQSTVLDDGRVSPPLDVPAGARLFIHDGQELRLYPLRGVPEALRLTRWGKDGSVGEWLNGESK